MAAGRETPLPCLVRRLLPLLVLIASGPPARALAPAAPRLVVVPPTPAARELAQALGERGCTLEERPAVAAPLAPEALARALDVDAVVELDLDETPERIARLRVHRRDGSLATEASIPLSGTLPNRDESGALASMTLQSLVPATTEPAPGPGNRPPGPPTVAGQPTVSPAESRRVPADRPLVEPSPEALGYTRLWAGPTASWRTQRILPPGAPYALSSPYAGFLLGADWFPFEGRARPFGFSLDYAYGAPSIHTPGASDERVHDHRLRGDARAVIPTAHYGTFGLHLGVFYEALLAPASSPLVTSTHLAPRLGVDWGRRIAGPVRVSASASVMPWAWPGNELRNTYGGDPSSAGLDASVGLDGPLLLRGLRWSVGYDYLRFEDRLGSTTGRTTQVEGVHRLGLSVAYEVSR